MVGVRTLPRARPHLNISIGRRTKYCQKIPTIGDLGALNSWKWSKVAEALCQKGNVLSRQVGCPSRLTE